MTVHRSESYTRLPPELFSIWQAYPWRFGETFCYLRPTILELTSYASVLTITAFTVERYIAICRPLLSHKIAVLSRAVKIIVCIWVVSLLVALPYAVHTRLFYAVKWPSTGQPVADSLVCSIPDKWLEGRMTYMFQISTFLFFLAPVTLISCLYVLIGIAIRRSTLARGVSASADPARSGSTHVKPAAPLPQQPRRVVIRMLVAVTVAFIICWAPFHTQRLMVLYVRTWTPHMLDAQSHIFYISGVLYFVSCTVNPILYNVISRRYRLAFKRTIFGHCTNSSADGSGCPQSLLLLRQKSMQRSVASLPPCRHAFLGQGSCTPPREDECRSPPRLVFQSDVKKIPRTSRRSDVTRGSMMIHAKRFTDSIFPVLLKLRKMRSDEKPSVKPEYLEDMDAEEASCTFKNAYRKGNIVYDAHERISTNSFPDEASNACSSHCPNRVVDDVHKRWKDNDSLVLDFDSNYDSNYNSECDDSNNEKKEFNSMEERKTCRVSASQHFCVSRPLKMKTKPVCRLCLSDSLVPNGIRVVDQYSSDSYPASCEAVMTS